MRDAGSFLLSELRFFTAADIIAFLLHGLGNGNVAVL